MFASECQLLMSGGGRWEGRSEMGIAWGRKTILFVRHFGRIPPSFRSATFEGGGAVIGCRWYCCPALRSPGPSAFSMSPTTSMWKPRGSTLFFYFIREYFKNRQQIASRGMRKWPLCHVKLVGPFSAAVSPTPWCSTATCLVSCSCSYEELGRWTTLYPPPPSASTTMKWHRRPCAPPNRPPHPSTPLQHAK